MFAGKQLRVVPAAGPSPILEDLLRNRERLRAAPRRHIPMTRAELDERGIAEPDIVLVTGDAYVDHPSFAMAIVGPSMYMLMLVVVIIQTPAYARLVRTATLAKKNSDFVLAERSLGAGPIRILTRHILPNIVGPLFIIGSMDIPTVVTLEAGLTYLGLGLPPPAPSWGRVLEEGYRFIRDAPWIVVAGGIPLIITTLGFTFLGESLRDLLDPKLRRMM